MCYGVYSVNILIVAVVTVSVHVQHGYAANMMNPNPVPWLSSCLNRLYSY